MLTFRNVGTLCAVAALMFVLPGCPSAEQEIGTGQLDGRTYTHDFFDLKMTVPGGWHILTRQQIEQARKNGRKITGMGGSSRRVVMLLAVSKLPPNAPLRGKFNPNLIIGAERVNGISRVDTGAKYLEKVGEHLKKTRGKGLSVSLGPVERHLKVGHYDMDARGVTVKIQGHTVRQRYYAVKVDDYFLFIGATYQSGEQWAELRQLLAAIH